MRSRYIIAIIIIGALVACTFLFFTFEKGNNSGSSISLNQVKNDLESFIKNSLGSSISDFSVECDSSGHNCNKLQKDPTDSGNASLTWKVLFYSDLYSRSEGESKHLALSKAIELTKYFLENSSNQWNSQSFVFAYAYIKTNDPEFLKAFFYSSSAFAQHAIMGNLFVEDYSNEIRAMTLIRYAEQLLLVSKFLESVPPEQLNSISFKLQNPNEKYTWLLANKDKIISESKKIVARILQDVKANVSQKELPPFRLHSSNKTKLDTCWLALGYALAYQQTSDDIFLKPAIGNLKELGIFTEPVEINDINAFYAQPVLACLNALKILEGKNQLDQSVINNLLSHFLNLYLDNKSRPLCSSNGGILNRVPLESAIYSEQLCQSNALKISDNAWLYEIINDIPDFQIFLSSSLN